MSDAILVNTIAELIRESEKAWRASNVELNSTIVAQLKALFEIQLERAKTPCPQTPSTEK